MAIRDLPPITPDPVIEAFKKDVDRTLLRENIKRTPTQRLEALMGMQKFSDEAERAMRAARPRR